jgi:hypothetical protein
MLRTISLLEFSHLEQIKIWALLVKRSEGLGIQGCFNLFQVGLFRNIHTSNVHGAHTVSFSGENSITSNMKRD